MTILIVLLKEQNPQTNLKETKMKKLLLLPILLLGIFFLSGCSEQVPPGFKGMVITRSQGLTGEILEPGRHECWGFDRMVLMEDRELIVSEDMSILCADDLNFKFDLQVRARLKTANGDQFKEILNRQGSQIQWEGSVGTLGIKVFYDTYVQPLARSIARDIVSGYETTQIRENRDQITKAIQEELLKLTNGPDCPMMITMVVTSNFDYPDIITAAVEKSREREIAIKEEQAKQAVELLKVENRLKIAEKEKITRVAEAEAEAAYNKILANGLTPEYLELRRLEALATLYESVGVGDKVIITDGSSNTPVFQLPLPESTQFKPVE